MAWLDPKGVSPMFFGRLAEFITWLGTEYNNLMKQLYVLQTYSWHFNLLCLVNICADCFNILWQKEWLVISLIFIIFSRILSTVAIHAFESILALYYCQKLRLDPGVTCCWMVQTLFMGIFSLRYLIWPQREERSAGNSKKSK